MENLIPIGSVVKTNDDKLYIITGFFPDDNYFDVNGGIAYIKNGEYDVVSFPCSMRIDFDMKKYKAIRNALNNYEWYDDSTASIRRKDIKKVLFEGYKDEAFYEFEKTVTK